MRVRDIIHRSGLRLRVALDPGGAGEEPTIRLSDPGDAHAGPILLDLHGGELLAAYLMSARLSGSGDLADEGCAGDHPVGLRLASRRGEPAVELDQGRERLLLAQPLWDRLYIELLLVLAHGRHAERFRPAPGQIHRRSGRLLH